MTEYQKFNNAIWDGSPRWIVRRYRQLLEHLIGIDRDKMLKELICRPVVYNPYIPLNMIALVHTDKEQEIFLRDWMRYRNSSAVQASLNADFKNIDRYVTTTISRNYLRQRGGIKERYERKTFDPKFFGSVRVKND